MKLLGRFPCYSGDLFTYLFYGSDGFRAAFSSFLTKSINKETITLFSNIEKYPKVYQNYTLSELDKMQDFVVVYHE